MNEYTFMSLKFFNIIRLIPKEINYIVWFLSLLNHYRLQPEKQGCYMIDIV